jgi:hypothetical protein
VRRHAAGRREKGERARRQGAARLGIDTLEAQQPILEVTGQRLHRGARRERIQHRRTEPVEPVVGIRLLRPLVQEFGEIADIPQCVHLAAVDVRRPHRRQRRPHGFRVVQANELATLLFEVRHAHLRQRLQRPDEPRPRPARSLGDASLLSPVPRQEDDDPIRFTELVGAKNQRVGSVERHEPPYSTVAANQSRALLLKISAEPAPD